MVQHTVVGIRIVNGTKIYKNNTIINGNESTALMFQTHANMCAICCKNYSYTCAENISFHLSI